MRGLALIIALCLAGPAQATQWFCQSTLQPKPEPHSAIAFRLILDDVGTFQAEGRRGAGGFGWEGQYTRYDNQMALIGAMTADAGPIEARAVSEHVQDDVLILTLQEDAAQSLMVRCLRHDLR